MLLMQKPPYIVGNAELACRAYVPSLEMLNERLITSIIPFGHGWKTDPPPFGTHLHFKNNFRICFVVVQGVSHRVFKWHSAGAQSRDVIA